MFGLAIVLETSHCVFLGHKTATGKENKNKKNKQTLCSYSSSVCLFADSRLHLLHSTVSVVLFKYLSNVSNADVLNAV